MRACFSSPQLTCESFLCLAPPRPLGGLVVLACWNMMIPFLVPELPEPQKEALQYGVKVPLVYTSVAVTNWRAFEKLGLASVSAPGRRASMP